MKRALKVILIILAALAVLGAAAVSVLSFGFGIDVFDRGGWYDLEEGGRQFRLYDGTPVSGWHTVEGKARYFDPENNCTLVTGWLTEGGRRYLLAQDGTVTVGWAPVEGERYWFAPSGAMHTGRLILPEGTYYLNENGTMHTGWLTGDGVRCFFDESGVMVTGWLELEGARHFFDETGAMVTGRLTLPEGTYYLNETGAMHTGWLEEDGKRYFFGETGAMVTGWLSLAEGRYFFDESGAMRTGWLELEGKRYWLKPSGILHTGWLRVADSLRYFREDGVMAVGRAVIDGAVRHFDARGNLVVLVNRWNYVPEDYTVRLVYVEGFRVAAQSRYALEEMMAACRAAGITCSIDSAYRSYQLQDSYWTGQVERYMARGYTREQAEETTSRSIAIPGTSEHQLGLAVDLTREQPTYDWLARHSWEYGFIMRYPYGKTDRTGIYYEPWHFRYVGRELAKELYESGLCLEEYLDGLTEQAGYGGN